ncbi:hypothetical protein LTR70_006360 [Exophiala xenobiotica]|uniref:Fe2OG dioxygenase domain-containing protein n=1 Tax=Lithohypha guttulata TaxID=1690604 RepID=A0ABR0K7U7_9EURO|nr:hypothetical protein LTR24_005829 [Lithohypha guttulata]KAK5316305.1 hypothetical protein LTR70_006360 [Exophiala xenobiotica]
MAEWLSPPGPPRLLTPRQVEHLIDQGHLDNSLARLSTEASAFFDQPEQDKFSIFPASHGTECGYYSIKGQKEYLTLRQAPPNATSDLQSYARELWAAVAGYLHRILCDISTALEIPQEAWAPLLEDSLAMPKNGSVDTSLRTILRLFRYAPNRGVAEEHIDNGFLTLCVGDGQGLQVLSRLVHSSQSRQTPEPTQQQTEAEWAEAEWADAAGATVLVGGMLHVLSLGRCRAGKHRVVANPVGRASTVFALRPCLRHDIDLEPFGGYGSVHARELYLQVAGQRTNINRKDDNSEQIGSG